MANTNEINGEVLQLEEQLWGFRLYDEQTALLTLLEFLFLAGRRKFEIENNNILCAPRYDGPSHLYLRTILFKNPKLETSSDWDDWETSFRDENEEMPGFPKLWHAKGLKNSFGDFENFRHAVRLLRSATDSNGSDRKWTFRFLFPWSQAQIYPDIKDKPSGTDFACPRNRFGRTGEMAWLLARLSPDKNTLYNELQNRFEDPKHPFAQLCVQIEKEYGDQPNVTFPTQSYLPESVLTNPIIQERANKLCDDLVALLRLELKTEDLVDPLSRIIGMHLICYQIECARHAAVDSRLRANERPFFLCEAIQRQSSAVRRESRENFQQNCNLCRLVLLENFASRFNEIEQISDIDNRCERFRILFGTRAAESKQIKERIRLTDLSELRKDMTDALENKFDRHSGEFHSKMSRHIGLTTKTFAKGYRYAPCDELLLALVLSTVRAEHMPLSVFLRQIYEKYGLVYDTECADAANRAQNVRNDLTANTERLLDQIRSLGLLEHLSDSCDYVINPYFRSANKS